MKEPGHATVDGHPISETLCPSERRVCRLGPEHLELLIPCYRQVYGEVTEWDEYKQCSKRCQDGASLFSISEYLQRYRERIRQGLEPDVCEHCGASLVDRWPHKTVAKHIRKEVLDHPQGIGVVLFQLRFNTEKERLVGTAQSVVGCVLTGFAWGYGADARELETEKNMPGLANKVYENFGQYEVFYQSEWGVISLLRNTGAGSNLFWCRLQEVLNAGHRVGILRTNPKTVSNTAERSWGYREIHRYPDTGVKEGVSLILGEKLSKVQQVFEQRHAKNGGLNNFVRISPDLAIVNRRPSSHLPQ